ncbi:hypothetical protein JGU66_28375 [Myxococcaceae bacterium JPH2]|nr:hypothetical protein [Myxococcaceae bacterium JPH2]
MSQKSSRIAAGFAASALLMSPIAARAAVSTGPIIIDPCVLYTLTLAGCQNPQNSCETAARERAKTDPDATCNTLIKQAAETQTASLPQRSVVVPTLRKSDGTTVSPAEPTRIVAIQKDDPNGYSMSGLGSFYLGQVHRAQTYIPETSAYSDYLANYRQQQRDAWNANGYALTSCNEYVYEKYYDYSVFEDAIVSRGNDYRGIYSVAYAMARAPYLPPASAIGTRGISDPIQRGKDGTPFSPAITFPQGEPKNQFFTVPVSSSSKVSILKGGTQDSVAYGPNGVILISMKDLQRTRLDLSGVAFEDPALKPLIDAGAHYYDESWAWHKQMNSRNATVLDEQMYELERKQEDFSQLLAKREELASTIASMFNPKPPLVGTSPRFTDNWWRDPVWNPDPIAVNQFAQVNINVLPQVGTLAAPTSAKTLAATSTQSAIVDPGGPVIIQQPPVLSPINTAALTNICTGNPIICLLYRLEALDGAIEQSLHDAQALGCLDFNTTGPAACDWSPKRFAKRVLGQYQVERETRFQKCSDYTDNDFTSLKTKVMAAGNVNYPSTDYTTSPAKLEQYFVRRDIYLNALRNVTGDLIDPATGKARVKWEAGDSYSMGDDTFGASATYNVSFEMSNLGQSDCAASPRAYGSFTATGRALGASVQLVNALADVTDQHAKVKLDVLDNSIHLVNVDKDIPVGTYNVVSGSKMKSATFVQAEVTFVIVVVPVTLGAKVGGTVGLNYAVDAKHDVTTTNGCKVNSIGVSGTVSPFASVDGELYAGVDLFIVSAGVKGKLQVVHASIPLQASAALVYGAGGNSVLTLNLAARSDLKFTFLSGSIAAFVEVGFCPFCVSYDATLVSWDGLHYDINLFNKSVVVPLADVQYLVTHAI